MTKGGRDWHAPVGPQCRDSHRLMTSAVLSSQVSPAAVAVLAGSQGGLLVAVGTHQPAVELLLLRPAGADGRSGAALQPLARLALGPAAALPPPAGSRAERRRAELVAALGLENGSGGGGGGGSQGLPRRHRGCIPESVQCLAPAGGEGQVQVGALYGAQQLAMLCPFCYLC